MTTNVTATNDFELAKQLEALDRLAEDVAPLDGLVDIGDPKAEGVDLFELLNLWWQEDIHSRMLTWLLDPNANHGLGDYFLTNFLLHSTGRAADLNPNPPMDTDGRREDSGRRVRELQAR